MSDFVGAPAEIYTDKNGKPLCDEAFLSIAHTKNIAVLALSSEPIGVDIERLDRKMPEKLSSFSIFDWTDAEAAGKLCSLPPRTILGSLPENVQISRFEKDGFAISLAEYK